MITCSRLLSFQIFLCTCTSCGTASVAIIFNRGDCGYRSRSISYHSAGARHCSMLYPKYNLFFSPRIPRPGINFNYNYRSGKVKKCVCQHSDIIWLNIVVPVSRKFTCCRGRRSIIKFTVLNN